MTRKRQNSAVSEILGVVLLLGITIALFGFLNYVVFSFSFGPSTPSVNLVGSIDKAHNIIAIEHDGGKTLDGNTQIIITLGNKTYRHSASELLSKSTWGFGDVAYFHYLDNITDRYIRVMVLDPSSNTLLLSVVLQQGLTVSGGSLVWFNDIVNSSSSNKGIESNFGNVQATAPDGNVMTLQESNYGDQGHQDPVDSASSDVDYSSDKGVENDFSDAQGTAPDSQCMTIMEATSGLVALDEHLYVDGITNTSTGWTFTGPSPALNSIGEGYIFTATDAAVRRWFTFSNTASTGDNLVVSLSIYILAGDGNDDVQWGIDVTGDNIADYSGTIANPMGAKWYTTGSIVGLSTSAQVNSSRVSFTYVKSGQANTMMIDAAQLNVTRSSTINNQIDLEYQWTAAPFCDSLKQLCFYVASHQTGSEALNVYYRNGSTWTSLGSITTTGWTNMTALGVTSPLYTIRLLGADETNDTMQDIWSIDCLFLNTYNTSNYRVDLVYQWTNAHYTGLGKTVCMYVTSHTGGSEILNVTYWNGASWVSLGTITSPGWKNFSAAGLNSPSYTIQVIGTIESGDTMQDTWAMDCMFLQSYSFG